MNDNAKHESMKREAIEDIIDILESGYDGYYCDLHNEVFNTGYYIIGAYEAKEALREYDVFAAIEKVQEYEQDNFGEVNTSLSDPEKLINMLYYIIGEEAMHETSSRAKELLDKYWNDSATDRINNALVKAYKAVLKED